ncbi:MAG: cupredoxin domain-containing protein [Chloroflexi bacterium]|nr:cupredoxin domain-containing protein [Chloroflexota bacterium]
MTTETAPRHDRRAATTAQRRAQREQARAAARGGSGRARQLAFAGIVLGVLAIGAFLAFGDFLNRPATASGEINIQSSMAGFTPAVITVKAGSTVTLDWWTQDAAIHLQNGVHTMVAPDLGLNEALPAESSRTVTWTVPNKPGTYDVWCESCCGGKDSPTMHGKIVVQPADSAGEARGAA